MSVQEITLDQMMKSPFILRSVNQIQTPLSLFQRFFGYMLGGTSIASDTIRGRDAGYDIFNATRQFSTAKAPGTPPHKVDKKPIGHQSVHLMRMHESIMVFDEEVYKMRPLGGQIGNTVDLRGQQYVMNQIKFMTQKFRNTREWVYSRMLRGGFNIKVDGDRYNLEEYDTSATDEISVSFQLPTDHTDRCPLGTGSDILDNWGSSSADIKGQILEINAAFVRIHGRPLRHIWIDSTTFNNMLENDGLQEVGGTAYRIFDSLTGRNLTSEEGIPDGGFDVVFRALPQQVFHVYDGVLSSDGYTEGTSTTETSKLIPSNYAIFMPEPDNEWHGLIEGSELVRETVVSPAKEVFGFYAWATPEIDPAGRELKFLDNSLPVMYNPAAIAYGYVGS